ncbi:hypothetical protein Tco_1067911 [Tanacetum coccineum]|uniref:Uncharacterized protein n=1 Tax=Tanacetum coccineum TaxID=301880 RepID=A0ABQ5HF40_9ASTR
MEILPVSSSNSTAVGTSEVTNNAGTSQTPNSDAFEEKDEEVELIVVPTAVKIPEEKVESRTSSTNSKKEETLTEPQKEKKDSSTDTLEDNPKIQAFRRELEEIALKHLGTVPENNSISTPCLAEAIRLDTLQKEEEAKQVHLNSLLAQRIAEEEELNEQQKKRRAQVQFEAQHYTDEDWDLIRAKIEANAELSKSVLGSDLQGEDFAKKMVELVNQRKKHFAEERARAKRNKPMTQSQLRTYMMNYLKNQGTWKLSQLKNLSFVEVKEEFDKLVKQVESFAPINFEATKDSLKRFGEELQTKTSKRLKSDEAKDDESTKKTGKRRKQIARKGLYSDKTDEDESEDSKDDDPISGTNIPINPVPVAIKPPSIATYKIIKQGEKGVYQIVREDGADIVYINFGAMLKDITRDDLTELYRIVMNRYGVNGPEDELEKVLWGYLKNMFEEPLSTDPIWSLLGQQRIISWRYYDTCKVHFLNLELMDIYMLIDRQYPLSFEVCKAMLDKKLQGGKPNEDCYRLLKWMEKQAGIRKHKDWLVQEQTALGKDFSNPLMADNLPKIIWLSTHHICLWIHLGAVYFVTIIVCYLLYKEYKYIASKRIDYFCSSKPQPHQFTILVSNIPVPKGNTVRNSVANFFTENHPVTYLATVVNIYNKIKNFRKVPNQRQYMRLDQFEQKLNELEGSVRSLENLISDLRLELPGNQTSVEVNRSDVHANKTN